MFRRSVIAFAAVALCALASTGCPSMRTVAVSDPDRVDGPDLHGSKGDRTDDSDEHISTRARLAKHRARNLDHLHAYWKAGVFPRNEQLPTVGNVFRDSAGRLCAAANLIHLDGYGHLVESTAKTNNFIRLADVHEGDLYDWILQSGFTQEEIAMIQVPYMPVQQISAEEERARLQQRLADVEERLRDDTEQSLAIAERELRRVEASRVMPPEWAVEPPRVVGPAPDLESPPEPRL